MNEQKRNELEAERMMSRMLSELMLKDENFPEVHRNTIMLIDKSQDIVYEIQKLADPVVSKVNEIGFADCNEETNPEVKQLSERAKQIFEYFDLIICGIQQFASTLNEED